MNFPRLSQRSVPVRYAHLHCALGEAGKETKTTTNRVSEVPNLFQDLTGIQQLRTNPQTIRIMHSTLLIHHFPTVRLFASAQSWIEGEALRQLYAASKLESMRLAVGF